jgi:uncharacterized membrane protein
MGMNIRARHLHAAESMANVIIGYLVNLVLVYFLMHLLGYDIKLIENASMGLVIACFAFLRGYIVRRVFNKIISGVYEQ